MYEQVPSCVFHYFSGMSIPILGNDCELILINTYLMLFLHVCKMKLLKLGEHLDYLAQGTILSLTEKGMLLILKQSIYAELQISQKRWQPGAGT